MTERPEPEHGQGRRYFLKQRIGAGAFGEVYLAEQDSGAGFRRPVALKVLNANVAGSKEAARRMRDEARILGRLSHRNIVGVLDLVLLGERWAVVMDYVPGADLEQVLHALELTEGTFPPAGAFEIGAAVCRALQFAWQADDGAGSQLKVVHRDIKPSNVRITADGEIKVLDFGVARVEMETREAQTRAQGWIGTERYMAPERILLQGDTLEGDVYATGASIVELVLGRALGRTPVFPEQHTPFVDEAVAEVKARLRGPDDVVDEAIGLLRATLDFDPKVRPAAAHLAVRFLELSRKLEGETLAAFAARFLPVVPQTLGYVSEPVEGVLDERARTPTRNEPTIIPNTGSPTWDPEAAPAPLAADARSGAPTSGSRAMAAAAMATFGVLSLLGLAAGITGVVLFTREPKVEPAPVPAVVAPIPVPEVAPVVAPAPVVVSEPVPAPVEPAPAPVETPPRPVGPRPAPVKPAPVVVVPDGPRVSAALVAVQDASTVAVTCGDVTARGTSSARITEFPAGDCTVAATWLGKDLTTRVRIDRRREVQCTANDGGLSCE